VPDVQQMKSIRQPVSAGCFFMHETCLGFKPEEEIYYKEKNRYKTTHSGACNIGISFV
jgi:hypothetical protein